MGDRRPALHEQILEMRDAAYVLALRLVGSSPAAEDAVQDACLRALALLEQGAAPENVRAWFLGLVAGSAKNLLRAEERLRRREARFAEEASREREEAAVKGKAQELREALRMAMHQLDADLRAPVSLRYEAGLSHAEVAAVLEIPERTARDRVERGLARLRQLLAGMSLALAPEIIEKSLAAGPLEHAPESLVKALEGLKASGSVKAAAVSETAKGGVAMKVIVGVVLAGALAGGVALFSGAPAGLGSPPEKPKSKFATPARDPSAEWEAAGPYAGSGALGIVDGPRLDFMIPRTNGLGACNGVTGAGNEANFLSYDPRLDRVHKVVGPVCGYLDGPFSRARFQGNSYTVRGRGATSLDGRYVFRTEPGVVKTTLRRLDLVKQEVKTLLPDTKDVMGVTAGKDCLYVVTSPWAKEHATAIVLNMDAKVEKELPLKLEGGIGGWGCALALDEVHDRLYAARQAVAGVPWYIWYWDLKDGSFHGVIPLPKKGEATHETGTIEGTRWYPEVSWVRFGPDDPEKRYLWTGCTDMGNVWVVDLVARETRALSALEGHGMATKRLGWVGNGGRLMGFTGHGGFTFLPDGSGDFWLPFDGSGPDRLFKRVK